MSHSLLFITWDQGPEMFTIPFMDWPVRWYGLLFALAFVFSQMVMALIYKKERRKQRDLDLLSIYIIAGTVIGARLGHCLFYSPAYYLTHPLDILKIWEGGLASHGGALGIIVGMILYCRKTGESWKWIFDRIVIVAALSSMLIRVGNLMNSEIIGKSTDSKTAFLFSNPLKTDLLNNGEIKFTDVKIEKSGRDTMINNVKFPVINIILTIGFNGSPNTLFAAYDLVGGIIQTQPPTEAHFKMLPNIKPAISKAGNVLTIPVVGITRHPTQLYESLFYAALFLFLGFLWIKKRHTLPQGFIFGLFCALMFSFRLLIEFLKERQELWEENQLLDMGQILSIPFILIGLFMMWWGWKNKKIHELPEAIPEEK